MEHRQLLILVRHNLTYTYNNMHRAKKALFNNLNLDGFVKMHNVLLKVPTRDRQVSLETGIQKTSKTPLDDSKARGTIGMKKIRF